MGAVDSITDSVNDVVDLGAALVPIVLVLVLIGLLVWRRAKPPRVVISEFDCDDKLCPSHVLSSLMVTEITSAGAGRLVERVADSSSVTPFDFAALAGDRAKWLATLLQTVSLRREVRISGIAFAANEHEVVLNVSIADTRNVVAQSRAFTSHGPGKTPQVLLRELVADAGSWTLYKLMELLGHGLAPGTGDDRRRPGRLLPVGRLRSGQLGRVDQLRVSRLAGQSAAGVEPAAARRRAAATRRWGDARAGFLPPDVPHRDRAPQLLAAPRSGEGA
jgi:hypothetical protein